MVETATRTNPYVGPRSFASGERLYGRDRERQRLVDLLIAERLVLFFAPSGAGKSSLIQAALIPALRAEGFKVWPVVRVGMDLPVGVAEGANRYLLSVMLSLEEGQPPEHHHPLEELARLSLADYLARHASDGADEVLIFDQFEEVLTANPADVEAKVAFFAQVGEALRDRGLWALFSIREDYLAGLTPYLRAIPTRLATTFRLDLLGDEAAREAVQAPAAAAGVTFADEAARRLVDDLRRVVIQRADGTTEEQPGPSVEPVQLQVVCRRLWEARPPEATTIGEADVAAVGTVDHALEDYYDEQVVAAAAATGVPERAIRAWCEEQLITAQDLRGQVIQEPGASQGLDNRAIASLIDAYLVRAEKRRGVIWYELAHDRLIRPIQRGNREWREANLSTLQRQAALWDDNGRSEGLLLRGEALAAAELWVATHAGDLTDGERAFLMACRAVERQAVRARRQRKLATFLAITSTVGCVLALVTAGVAGYFFNEARTAEATAVALAGEASSARLAAVNAQATAIALAASAQTRAEEEEQAARAARGALALQAVAAQATTAARGPEDQPVVGPTRPVPPRGATPTPSAPRPTPTTGAGGRPTPTPATGTGLPVSGLEPCPVTPFAQTDQRWAEERLRPQETVIRLGGDLLTAVAMIYEYFGVETDPGRLNACAGDQANPFQFEAVRRRCAGAAIPRPVLWNGQATWADLQAQLAAGRPVIVGLQDGGTGSRFLVVTRGRGNTAAGYAVIDPSDGATDKTLADFINPTAGYTLRWLVVHEGARPRLCRVDSAAVRLAVEFLDVADGGIYNAPRHVRYRVAGATAATRVEASHPDGALFEREGDHTVTVTATRGEQVARGQVRFTIDLTPPLVSAGWEPLASGGGRLEISATDAQTMVVEVQYGVDDGPWVAVEAASNTRAYQQKGGVRQVIPLPDLPPGARRLRYTAVDAAGNRAPENELTVGARAR